MRHERHPVLVATGDPKFLGASRAALSARFDLAVVDRSVETLLKAARTAHIIVLEWGAFATEAASVYERVQAAAPGARIMLALTHVDPWTAVELLKCGVSDLVRLPADPDVLLRKVTRAALGASWPAEYVPGLSATPPVIDADPAAPLTQDSERRETFRVKLAPDTLLVVKHGSHGLRFPVADLSIRCGRQPGGLSFVMPRGWLDRPPYCDWRRGTTLQAWLKLADRHDFMTVNVTLVNVDMQGGRMGVQYETTRVEDRKILRAYWVKQQHSKRSASSPPGQNAA